MSAENKFRYNAVLATGAFAIGLAGVAGCAPKQEQSTQTNIPEKQATATMPSLSSKLEIPTGTFNITPTATLRAYSYPTPTETPKPPEKSPLPSYSVFFGNVMNEKTNTKMAELVIASIPQKQGPEEIFYYYITTKNEAGARGHGSTQAKISRVQENRFQTVVFRDEVRGIDAEFIEKDKSLVGKFYVLDSNSKFELKLIGTGKQLILNSVRRIMNDLSSDQPKNTLVEDYVEDAYKKWP